VLHGEEEVTHMEHEAPEDEEGARQGRPAAGKL
jgi:hypothetical protein